MQSVQLPPATENLPGAQFTQFARAFEPTGDDFPAAQFKHTEPPP
jgi:hypothetical protein